MYAKVVLQSLSNECRAVLIILDMFVAAALVTRAELATRVRNTTDFVIGRSVKGGASEQNTT